MGLINWFKSLTGRKSINHKECLQILDMVLDDEMEESEEFRNHLEVCMPCYEQYNLDKAIKKVLKARCQKQPVPEDLSDSIRQHITNHSIG